MYQVKKWGNSLGIRIPKSVSDELLLREDSEVYLYVENDRLIIEPKRKSLQTLVDDITEDNIHSEIEFGRPEGGEVW
ncbi:multidrug transporter MatE [Sporosarcina luteola]|uniref:Multidrug transporter MatE n=1 Tax=Sporosarcina luteola TaxID=582850 RepID=A0A511Z9M9_9BACL|nr:AbrB/MazE/SpoVT family DNA-binding domain-containing protein [Sporosarcina luteola]GEN84167.1 multidrug transporter MatE [Sporosarcina luteola]